MAAEEDSKNDDDQGDRTRAGGNLFVKISKSRQDFQMEQINDFEIEEEDNDFMAMVARTLEARPERALEFFPAAKGNDES
jgi:hypothetical protein